MRVAAIRTLIAISVLGGLAFGCAAPAASPAASAAAGGGELTGKAWQWTASTLPDASTIPDPASYTVEFLPDGSFASKVDCNQVAGQYATTDSGGLTITPGPSTMAACPEGSLADIYIDGLSGATSYAITNGQLVITSASGTMTFS